jgi:prepilin-type N-terminal cleavage/methylation domain-containing protein
MDKNIQLYKKNNHGFTMIEFIIVLSVLGFLFAIAIPNFMGVFDKSKQRLCLENRNMIMRFFALRKTENLSLTLSEFLTNPGDNSINNLKCPSGGVYSVITIEGQGNKLVCSVHNEGDEEIPFEQEVIPGTDVPVNSTWPEYEDFFNDNGASQTYYLYEGQTFFYDGEYYVVIQEIDIWIAPGAPMPTPYGGWWGGTGQSGILRITGRIIEWPGGTGSTFNSLHGPILKGDMVHWNDAYYAFKYIGWVNPPNEKLDSWIMVEYPFQ